MKFFYIILSLLFSNILTAQFEYEDRSIIEDNRPQDIFELGDLSGDGVDDIVYITSRDELGCFEGDKNLVWIENDGNGKFLEERLVQTISEVPFDDVRIIKINIADYDNDGLQDIAILLRNFDNLPPPNGDDYFYIVRFYKNLGNGIFDSPTEIFNVENNNGGALDFVSVDNDNDGDIDLIVSLSFSEFSGLGRLYQIQNLGNGNFQTITQEINSFELVSIIPSDINGDTYIDLVGLDSANNSIITLVINDGNGNYNYNDTGYFINNGDDFILDLELGDFNNDNYDDILLFTNSPTAVKTLNILLNNGISDITNNFSDSMPLMYSTDVPNLNFAGQFEILDVNDDEYTDIIYTAGGNTEGNTIIKVYNNGDLTFEKDENSSSNGPEVGLVGIANLDEDTIPDLVTRVNLGEFGSLSPLGWYKIDDELQYNFAGRLITSNTLIPDNTATTNPIMQIVDIDGDDYLDILMRNRYYLNLTNGVFSTARSYFFTKHDFRSMHYADYNGDGILDAAYTDSNNLGVLFKNQDGTEINLELTSSGNASTSQVVSFDYESDGDMDIVNIVSNTIFINDGFGNFELFMLGTFRPRESRINYKDLNDDGILDFSNIRTINGTEELWVNLSNGPYNYDFIVVDSDLGSSSDGFFYYNFTDYDHDGDIDFVYTKTNINPMQVMISYNEGNDTFSESQTLLEIEDFTNIINIRYLDIDINGFEDVVIIRDTGEVNILFQISEGQYSESNSFTSFSLECSDNFFNATQFELADIDGDQIDNLIINGITDLSWIVNNLGITLETLDFDQDGIPNVLEDLNNDSNLDNDDTDGDGIANYYDLDDDGDSVDTIDEIVGIGAGLLDNVEYEFIDTDDDNIENYLDDDDDGDLILTVNEDYNNNGTPLDDDLNGNSIPDFLDSDVALSVDTFEELNYNLYPNPVLNFLTIDLDDNLNFQEVEVFDFKGKRVGIYASKKLNLINLKSGLYILKIYTDQGTFVSKVIKD